MKHKEKKSLPEFEAISSAPDAAMNFLFIFLVFCLISIMPITSVVSIVISNNESKDGYLTFYVVLFTVVIITVFMVALIYENRRAFTSTIIDEKGIRYYNKFKDVVVKDLPWSSFAKREELSYDPIYPRYDIRALRSYKSGFDQFLWGIMIDKKNTLHKDFFRGGHFFCMFYSNRIELIKTFLLGVAHYRPDLTVDPEIFPEHSIDPETYVIDYKQKSKIAIIGWFLVILTFVIVYFFV